jgi:hypothetical protein
MKVTAQIAMAIEQAVKISNLKAPRTLTLVFTGDGRHDNPHEINEKSAIGLHAG